VGSETYNGYALLRALPASDSAEDRERAVEMVKRLRLYPLAQAGSPPQTRHLDIAGRLFDGIARYDDTFYERLARMVGEEPVSPRDQIALAQLRSIGIERGRPFRPDPRTREILRLAAAEAHAGFVQEAMLGPRYFPGSRWVAHSPVGPLTSFTFREGDDYYFDARGAVYYLGCAPSRAPGAATLCLCAMCDANGASLSGERAYRLRLPPDAPVREHWSATAYDLETAGFIPGARRIAVDSRGEAARNPDGSVDLHFAPSPPEGREASWIATAPGRPWFALFRFHGAERGLTDRSWTLPNLERV
jgi:hypothetical protein